MNLNELKSAMLEVLDRPTQIRIIVETRIPSLSNNLDPIYYMIDRGECAEPSLGQPAKIYNYWHVTNSAGEGYEAPDNFCLLELFAAIPEEAISRVYVESF